MNDLPQLSLVPGSSSMFSPAKGTLDPRLFQGGKMHPEVREELLHHFYSKIRYNRPQDWAHVWLAGSGASYQWSDQPHADLDMMVGVDYPEFRAANGNFSGLTDDEISWVLNKYMRENLNDEDWHGTHEMTWYNNPLDLRKLNPYAAYSLTDDDWHVQPSVTAPLPYGPNEFGDTQKAQEILNRYTRARESLQRRDLRPEVRKGHARSLQQALAQGHALFEDIHGNRKLAFTPGGAGYGDPANVRWQTGKATGVVQTMRAMSEQYKKSLTDQQIAQYGMTFPDVNELIIRAMLQDER